MLTTYMIIWSLVMIAAIGITRIRNMLQLMAVILVTVLVLFFSQALFEQLSLLAGVAPSLVLFDPGTYLSRGPMAWLALMVMPCGWLGPMIGLHLIERWQRFAHRHN